MLGNHLVKSWSTTQTAVAMPSGEAEYYGAVKGACEAIGITSLIEDLTGRRITIELETDSSAAKGIGTRRGVGKVRHLETRTLWLQDQVDRKRIRIKKINGEENAADLCTKHLAGDRLRQLLSELPAAMAEGRHELAPNVVTG